MKPKYKTAMVTCRATDADASRFKREARASGQSLSAWIIEKLRAACKKSSG
jgi:predicted HicB family RNase H-like nuclease